MRALVRRFVLAPLRPHPSRPKRQIIHSNYAILMTIKLLIRNKKVLDVAIVIRSLVMCDVSF